MKARHDREQTGAVTAASPRGPLWRARIARLAGIALLAVTMLGAFAASASARVDVFLGLGGPVYHEPYPRSYYYSYDAYAYSPYYEYDGYVAVPRSVWIPGHWERRHHGWRRGAYVWVPGYYR